LEGVVPEVKDEGVVNVKEARHPILLLRGIEGVVGSDVEIGEGDNQGLILTGPNSGGKTVILKLLGLYAFMVRDGIPVPSKAYEDARVDFFSPILADIGDLQSVDGDLSTFSGHMLVCREVLNNAGKNALVLMDELGSGTDPAQGVAIARALLEALLDRGCRVAITTHYMELKQLATSDSRFAVAGMQFLGGVPTYKLIPGMIGESFALAVAERLKLPSSVISRANELLDSDTRRMGELIQNLEEQKELVEQKAQVLKKREMEMLELKAEMKRQQERLEAKQLDARRVEAQKFAAKLEEKEKLLEDILEKLKGSGASKKVVADSWTDIRIVKREALSEAERLPGLMSRGLQQPQDQVELIPISEMKGVPELKVDDKVLVCKKGAFYGSEGTIQQVGKKIQVAVGDVSVRLTLKEIAFPPSAGTSDSTPKTKIEATISKLSKRGIDLEAEEEVTVDISNSGKPRDSGSTMQMKSNTVDCIGKKLS
jgi:DNA mismatch repair protein MutS2